MTIDESREAESDASAAESAEPAAPESPKPPQPSVPERRDEDGLPLDRKPTIDDVRGNDGSHRLLAMGCSAIVILAIVAFFVIRVIALR